MFEPGTIETANELVEERCPPEIADKPADDPVRPTRLIGGGVDGLAWLGSESGVRSWLFGCARGGGCRAILAAAARVCRRSVWRLWRERSSAAGHGADPDQAATVPDDSAAPWLHSRAKTTGYSGGAWHHQRLSTTAPTSTMRAVTSSGAPRPPKSVRALAKGAVAVLVFLARAARAERVPLHLAPGRRIGRIDAPASPCRDRFAGRACLAPPRPLPPAPAVSSANSSSPVVGSA